MTTEQQIEATQAWLAQHGYIPFWSIEPHEIGDLVYCRAQSPFAHPLSIAISQMGRYRIIGRMTHAEVVAWHAACEESYDFPLPYYKTEVVPD